MPDAATPVLVCDQQKDDEESEDCEAEQNVLFGSVLPDGEFPVTVPSGALF